MRPAIEQLLNILGFRKVMRDGRTGWFGKDGYVGEESAIEAIAEKVLAPHVVWRDAEGFPSGPKCDFCGADLVAQLNGVYVCLKCQARSVVCDTPPIGVSHSDLPDESRQ